MVLRHPSSCRTHTGTQDQWREQPTEVTACAANAEPLRAAAKRPFAGRTCDCDKTSR